MKKISTVFIFLLILSASITFAQIPEGSGYNEQGERTGPEQDTSSDQSDEPVVFSQEELNLIAAQEQAKQDSFKTGEFASCSEYYEFGSVDINLTQDYIAYDAGDPVYIRGTIKNNNSYPVVGMDIKARLVKDIPEPQSSRSEIMILDDFDIAQNLTLDAGEEYQLAYSHLLPLNAPSGQYELYFYAVEQDRYNLSGLSFTNDIVGSKISFDVKGNRPDHVYLDQTKITVGEQEHNVMSSMTQQASNTSIPVSIPLYNPETEAKEMTVTYNLYSWDAANPQNLITSKTEQVTVPPQSEEILTYTIENGTVPVYYLSIIAKPTNPTRDESVFKETSIANIGFTVQDISKPRINFSGVNTYPLKMGSEATLVTCFHNTNEGDAPYAKIETLLKDTSGKILAQTVYEGSVSSDIEAIIQKFNPKRNLSNFVVSTIVYDKDNKIIDQIDKVYACEDINPDTCPTSNSMFPLILGVIAVCIIGLGILFVRKNSINIERV